MYECRGSSTALRGRQLDVARRYLDGDLEFARAARELEEGALMPSADATLKFFNEFRTYAVAYTVGRDAVARDRRAGGRPLESVPTMADGDEVILARRDFAEGDAYAVFAIDSMCCGAGCRLLPKSNDAAAAGSTAAPKAAAASKLGIRPDGDTEIKPDISKITNEDLKKVFAYIDEHIDEHVENLQKWIQQPSISNSGEGIPESAEMVKGFFEQLGCQDSRVYDVGITEWGAPGNPVVYAKCDEGAPRTLAIYWMYDTMPVTQPDAWMAPPFEARLVEQAPFKKVLIGRGATNSKGPQMAQWNALMAIKAVTGKLPVNLIFVAEGDEERMDVGFRQFVKDHPDLFKGADAMIG